MVSERTTARLQELFGRDVEVVTERMLDDEIRADVLREAVAL